MSAESRIADAIYEVFLRYGRERVIDALDHDTHKDAARAAMLAAGTAEPFTAEMLRSVMAKVETEPYRAEPHLVHPVTRRCATCGAVHV